jgi:RNA polymerase sigma-70 factor (ECF subfamily)
MFGSAGLEEVTRQKDHDNSQVETREEAFTALYQRHKLFVYRYALARTGNVPDAQDITSQTFLAALKGFGTYQGHSKVSTWLLGIARHKIVDYMRRSLQHTSLEQDEVAVLHAPGIEGAVQQSLDILRVLQAMSALTEDRREAISLHLFAELTIQETAVVMERTYPAVQMLIHRGLNDLRTRLQEE